MIDEVKIIPITRGACKICGVCHAPELPHELTSIYYLNWFYQKNKRFPTWEDAMSHCSEKIQEETKEKLRIAEKERKNGRDKQHHNE